MENRCRICNKKIGEKYTDKLLFCWRCRKSVENAIGYRELKAVGVLNDEIRRVNENLRKENKKLKEGLKILAEICGQKCEDGKRITKIIHNGMTVWKL